eukprot:scaffold34446_cov73-Phaeocystis_antarctica.AAC.3
MGFVRRPISRLKSGTRLTPSCGCSIEASGRPTSSAIVGNTSIAHAGCHVMRGAIVPGHSTMPGTRMPPSSKVFLAPARPPAGGNGRYCFGSGPLSLENQTSVVDALVERGQLTIVLSHLAREAVAVASVVILAFSVALAFDLARGQVVVVATPRDVSKRLHEAGLRNPRQVRVGKPHRREEGLPLLHALLHELNGLSHEDGARLARICVYPFQPAEGWVEVEYAKVR